MPNPLDLLDQDRIRSRIGPEVLKHIDSLEVFSELGSTNAHLLRAPAPAPGNLAAALAEYQHAGRGRMGRKWIMPPCSGIGLSVAWSFPETPDGLPALALAAGVVARRAIQATCSRAPVLKWPNDLLWNDRKLGGILVETASGRGGPYHVVVGLGLNVSFDSRTLWKLGGLPGGATDLATMTDGRPPRRNDLAARLIEGYFAMFGTFEKLGFAAFRGLYREADYLRRRPVTVTDGPVRLEGTAEGVDSNGALILNTADGKRRIFSGDVTVRPAR